MKISEVLLDNGCASQLYLIRVQLIRVTLPFTHDTNFHGEEDVGLLCLDERQPWLVQVDVVLLVEVIVHAHICDLAGGFLCHIKFVLLGIELRNLLDRPNL